MLERIGLSRSKVSLVACGRQVERAGYSSPLEHCNLRHSQSREFNTMNPMLSQCPADAKSMSGQWHAMPESIPEIFPGDET